MTTPTSPFSRRRNLFQRLDYRSPLTILGAITVAMGFYAGGHFMQIGLFLACGMSLSMLILLSKSPEFVKEWAFQHPLISDLVLSSLATVLVSGFFGQGLTLGIAAVVTALILSVTIPLVTKYKPLAPGSTN